MNVIKNEKTLKKLLAMYGFQDRRGLIVVDVAAWWRQYDDSQRLSPHVPAISFISKDTNMRDMAIRDELTDKEISSIAFSISRNAKLDYSYVIAQLPDVKKYFVHTVLHEIAHMKDIEDHGEADIWAFEELKKIPQEIFDEIILD